MRQYFVAFHEASRLFCSSRSSSSAFNGVAKGLLLLFPLIEPTTSLLLGEWGTAKHNWTFSTLPLTLQVGIFILCLSKLQHTAHGQSVASFCIILSSSRYMPNQHLHYVTQLANDTALICKILRPKYLNMPTCKIQSTENCLLY